MKQNNTKRPKIREIPLPQQKKEKNQAATVSQKRTRTEKPEGKKGGKVARVEVSLQKKRQKKG